MTVTTTANTSAVACTAAGGDCWNDVPIAKTAATSSRVAAAADTVAADLGMQCGGGPA